LINAFSIIKNESIGIFGDYDVDGATSTALLLRYFLSINQKIHIHIPDRKKEGYGPTIKGFENLINLEVKLIITVDCGTMSFEPIKNSQDRNIDVIVLDHHQSDLQRHTVIHEQPRPMGPVEDRHPGADGPGH